MAIVVDDPIVNNWGKLGHWRYAKIRTPYELSAALGVALTS